VNSAAFQHANAHAQARRHFAAGAFASAAGLLRRLAQQQPSNAEVQYDLGRCCLQLGQFDDARRALQLAAKLAPNVPQVHSQLARAYLLENKFDLAHEAIDVALRLSPAAPDLLARKADIYFTQGRYQEAYDALAPAIDADPPSGDIAFALARVCARVDKREQGAVLLRRIVDRGELAPFVRSQALFRLGGLLDGLGRYDEAFAAYAEANRIRARPYDPRSFSAAVDRLIAAWTPEAVSRLPRSQWRCDLPVFIVGMPRSGTTLVEQILASHPKVFGGGERSHLDAVVAGLQLPATGDAAHFTDPGRLTTRTLEQAARDYVRRLAIGAGSAQRITDKLPTNFVHVGLIRAMLPQARLIHTTRDPMDTCLSCHFQSWTDVYPWVNDLAHIGAYYRDYRRLMRHWISLPDVEMLEVPYEQLTAEQETWSRRMIEHLGLAWDDRCLQFYKTERSVQTMNQDLVRQPIYRSSVERWRNYEKHLGPLRKALAEGH